MPTDRQLDDQLSRWLEAEAPGRLPDRVLNATFERTRRIRQQGGWRALLGRIQMPKIALALGGAAIVVVAVLALGLNNVTAPGVGGQPSPTPSPTSTPSPSSSAAAGVLPQGPFLVEGEPSITVSIPGAGWTFDDRFSALMKGEEVDNLPEAAILLWAWPAGTEFYVYGDPCQWKSTRPETPVTTAAELAAALAAQPTRDASTPVDVTVDGHAGTAITLHVPDDAVFTDCDESAFASYGVPGDEPTRTAQGPGQIDEFWILDVDGGIVILDAMYRPDTSAELVDELRSIATSATFDTP